MGLLNNDVRNYHTGPMPTLPKKLMNRINLGR